MLDVPAAAAPFSKVDGAPVAKAVGGGALDGVGAPPSEASVFPFQRPVRLPRVRCHRCARHRRTPSTSVAPYPIAVVFEKSKNAHLWGDNRANLLMAARGWSVLSDQLYSALTGFLTGESKTVVKNTKEGFGLREPAA